MNDTLIHILEGVDLTDDYVNTFSFSTLTSQYTFFYGKRVKDIVNASFQRLDDGTQIIRVNENVENLRNANYVMFRNGTTGKWYYCFVDKVVYSSNTVTHLHYTVDVMQTWYFDMNLKRSFVEREHTATDNIGEHLIDENLNGGELVANVVNSFANFNNLSIVLATNQYPDYTEPAPYTPALDISGISYTGVYQGYAFYAFHDDLSGIQALNNLIKDMDGAGITDAISSIFMIPSDMLPTHSDGELIGGINPIVPTETIDWTVPKIFTTLNGYTPRNRKLYTYPYNYLRVSNNQGGYADIKLELCTDSTIRFNFSSEIAQNATVVMSIENYKGELDNYDEGLVLTGFPTCSWTKDIYANWVAQNKAGNFVSALSSVGGLAFGVAQNNPQGVFGGVMGVAGLIGQYEDKKALPNVGRGTPTGSAMIANNRLTFTFKEVSIKAEHARMIDEYFDMFGYRVNRVKLPEIKNRPYWNYVKTNNVNITGNINQKDMKVIKENFNRGITFWHGDYVGDYSRNNTVAASGGGDTPLNPPTTYDTNSLGYGFPIADGYSYTITSPYGPRIHPITGEESFHTGIDLATSEGVPLVSVLPNGVVIDKGFNSTYGNFVQCEYIKDGNNIKTFYGHMLNPAVVNIGDDIGFGQIIGNVGTTGLSTGNHVHFEFRITDVRYDPWNYINPSL